ncbi:MAG: amino acid adenylation domain-containing protein, partial [bacterium]|nr:amino acid adenylation domain-containing protein [bacterium]
ITGMLMKRTPDMVIGILGILKAGSAYLPIAPAYPQERILYMLDDSRAKLLLSHKNLAVCLEFDGKIMNYEPERLEDRPSSPVAIPGATRSRTGALAYVMYTSGSTGKPKGVMIEQGNVINLIDWFGRSFNIQKETRVLQMTDYTFDPSVEDIFGTLLYGGMLFLSTQEMIADRELFRQYIETHQIQIINYIPTILKDLLLPGKKLESLRVVISGGERLEDSLKDRLLEAGYRLYNHYGPTEITTDALTSECKPDQPVVLGKPIANYRAYIFDKRDRLSPVGIPGELCISGAGVARGYLNNPVQTAEHFVTIDASRWGQRQGETRETRIYKTGDLCRWLPDGNIEYLGRIDQQIKIRGHRIEPGEIENKLLAHHKVKETIVVALTGEIEPGSGSDTGDNYLCAYIVAGQEFESQELREFLAQDLPDYMLPAFYITIENIPLTPNGKPDLAALPRPEIKSTGDYTAPGNEIETQMVNLWAEILDRPAETLGIDSNFFEKGGHSLKATMLAAKLHKVFDVEIPLTELFKYTTIREQADYMKKAEKDKYESVEPAEKKEYYPLSPAQERLYILQQLTPGGTVYNMPITIPMESPDPAKLEQTLRQIIKRHESLRTSFQLIDEKPVQVIHDNVNFELENLDAHKEKIVDGRWSRHFFSRFFDLSRAPLLRAALVKVEEPEDKYLFLVDMHHIIADGVSLDVLERDFFALYEEKTLPSLRLQYKDYSEWQNNDRKNENKKKQEIYWLKQFEDEIPVLDLPLDYPRPAIQSFEGDMFHFALSAIETETLKTMASAGGATMFMVLLSVLNTLLAKLGNPEDIIIGTPVAGRRHADLENIIGMFVNTLPLRNFPKEEKTFKRFLQEVKGRTLDGFENQEYQFE